MRRKKRESHKQEKQNDAKFESWCAKRHTEDKKYSNIDAVHKLACESWCYPPDYWIASYPNWVNQQWKRYDIIPPWKPSLRDVVTSVGKCMNPNINITFFFMRDMRRKIGGSVSLDSYLKPIHIVILKDLCDKIEQTNRFHFQEGKFIREIMEIH